MNNEISINSNIAKITVTVVPTYTGAASVICSLLAQNGINIDTIQAVENDGVMTIVFTVHNHDSDPALDSLRKADASAKIHCVKCEKDQTKITVNGDRIMSKGGIAMQVYDCLYNAGIDINMVSSSQIRFTVLVNGEDAKKAIDVILKELSVSDERSTTWL